MTDNKHSHEEQRGFVKGTALGVALGGVAGALAGILFAPQSGKETRAQIAKTLKNAAAELEERIKHVRNSVEDFSDAAGKDLAKLLDRATELKDEIVAFGKNTFDKGVDLNDETRKQAQKLISQSQKIANDLDRILAHKLDESKSLAADTAAGAKEIVTSTAKEATKSVKKNTK